MYFWLLPICLGIVALGFGFIFWLLARMNKRQKDHTKGEVWRPRIASSSSFLAAGLMILSGLYYWPIAFVLGVVLLGGTCLYALAVVVVNLAEGTWIK